MRTSICVRSAYGIVARGRDAFDSDIALPLAVETLCSRVGEIAKRLVAADPKRFGDPVWSLAARNRDFLIHSLRPGRLRGAVGDCSARLPAPDGGAAHCAAVAVREIIRFHFVSFGCAVCTCSRNTE